MGRFFSDRWQGRVPLSTLFWRDMAIYGTLINIVTTIGSLVLFASDLPDPAAMAVYVMPFPYNLFLTMSVWRTAERRPSYFAGWAKFGALAWMVGASLL